MPLLRAMALETALSFNGATSFRTWIGLSLKGRLGAAHGFNGATSFRTWIVNALHREREAYVSFNGATSFRTWIATLNTTAPV